MRRVRYSVAASLDGFIAGPKGEYDWIPEEPAIDFVEFLKKIDGLLMGRHTWNLVESTRDQVEFPDLPTWVFSRTLKPEDCPNATLVSEDAAGFVAALKREPGKDLWLFGGGALFASLLEAGVVDTVEVAIVPVLLGSGVPLLPPPVSLARLHLHSTEAFPSGIVLAKYQTTES